MTVSRTAGRTSGGGNTTRSPISKQRRSFGSSSDGSQRERGSGPRDPSSPRPRKFSQRRKYHGSRPQRDGAKDNGGSAYGKRPGSGSRNQWRKGKHRGRPILRKKKKVIPQRKNIDKLVRSLLGKQMLDAALAEFRREKAEQNPQTVSGPAAQSMMSRLAQDGNFAGALEVSQYMQEKSYCVPLKAMVQSLMSVPRTNVASLEEYDAFLTDVLNLLPKELGGDEAARAYAVKFVRLIILEFMEDGLGMVQRLRRMSPRRLQHMSSALTDLQVVRGKGVTVDLVSENPDTLLCDVEDEDRTCLNKWDSVLLRKSPPYVPRPGSHPHPHIQGPHCLIPTAAADTASDSEAEGGAQGVLGHWEAKEQEGETEKEEEEEEEEEEEDFGLEYEGVVTSADPLQVKLVGVAARPRELEGAGWTVVRMGPRITVERQLDALKGLVEGSKLLGPQLRELLLGCGDPQAIKEMAAQQVKPAGEEGLSDLDLKLKASRLDRQLGDAGTLNASQAAALKAAMGQRLTLIQGPPGTGKTHTSVALIKMWIAQGVRPILATSDSNVAVDNILSSLVEDGVKVCRVGRAEAVREDLNAYGIDRLAGADYGPASYGATSRVLRSTDVVCATASVAGSDFLERITFQAVLADEAAQATEPALLVPLMRGAKQLALVGDHAQLPPTIVSRTAELDGLATSLFTRMVEAGVPPHLLDTQYRMHPHIAHFPSRAFYGGNLLSGVPREQRPVPEGFAWPLPGTPVALVPTDGVERGEGVSYTNEIEAEMTMMVIEELLRAGDVGVDQMAVVTPYAGQVKLVRRQLQRRGLGRARHGTTGIEVASVDGFQGREKEVIIFSAVRANERGMTGFVGDEQRVNVMMTRAKRGLIVLGHVDTLRADRTWRRFIQWCQGAGLVCGEEALSVAKQRELMSLEHDATPLPERPSRPRAAATPTWAGSPRGGARDGRSMGSSSRSWSLDVALSSMTDDEAEEVKDMLEERKRARRARDFETADTLRRELYKRNINVGALDSQYQDSRGGRGGDRPAPRFARSLSSGSRPRRGGERARPSPGADVVAAVQRAAAGAANRRTAAQWSTGPASALSHLRGLSARHSLGPVRVGGRLGAGRTFASLLFRMSALPPQALTQASKANPIRVNLLRSAWMA